MEVKIKKLTTNNFCKKKFQEKRGEEIKNWKKKNG